ncbi:OsmC family protein [Polynucleobacter sp. AP-Nino-20-G2]|uniref:OsmC family protein n=1 Tax=Polynucleobacter sp. AP-Nino-20-G2 TaxID=2576917 RepID=UPI001BFDFE70|nr:OsmC family protein [Polynucleobacter sp. AP-Nino-20-G2]QWE16014.1 OsmC family protein [Polynucleobacter sp. AP-Nino-20-G2]
MGESPSVRLVQQSDYQFSIYYNEERDPIFGDEPPPLGRSQGATPSQFLLAGVANCLSDSLLFALRKFKQNPEPIETKASCEIGRNDQNRLRILKIDVEIRVGVPGETLENLDRVLAQFQDFCTVSSSVSLGIPVNVTVIDSQDKLLYPAV